MRGIVCEIDSEGVRLVTDDGAEHVVRLRSTPFASMLDYVRTGDEMEVCENTVHRGVITPKYAVIAPDQLVDVTTLCGCMKHYGFHALNMLVQRFESSEPTWQIQLGNLANDFFDCCVNEVEPTFEGAVARSFRNNSLLYTSIDGINAGFFHDARQQWQHIYDTVRTTLPANGIASHDMLLEPQFIVPELGLQGRMDALGHNVIIELKSGKADEFRGGKPKEEHEMQMMLYSEMRRLTHGTAARNILFYSRYPKLIPVNYTLQQTQKAIAVRNDIVELERRIREGGLPQLLDSLKESDFNTMHETGKLYCNYMRPVIERFLTRMQTLPDTERAYFHTFVRFLAREQYACKQAFAHVWCTPIEVQEVEGEAVTQLTLSIITDSEGCITELRCNTPHDLSAVNFRRGDTVMLFEEGLKGQVFRCQITGMAQHSLHLSLNYKQRSDKVFNLNAHYVLTPSYMESSFGHAYRGLTATINCEPDRRTLLLGIRQPADNEYMLVVGPPGTGKTSVFLRNTVRERIGRGERLLVMAYTNQAVDEICSVLDEECGNTYARIGNTNSCAIPFRRRMMQELTNQATNRQQIAAVIGSLQVICGTIASIGAHDEIFRLMRFDTTIVDEASQVLEPHILPILCRVGRFILIGDHKQLPAVVVQNRTECETNNPLLHEIGLTNCANSYFERLYALQHKWGIAHRTTHTLSKQGRMHPELMHFVNRHFYKGELDIVPLPHQTAALPYPALRTEFIDSREVCNTIKSNAHEAEIVARVIADIEQTYRQHGMDFSTTKTIGVIVPFRAQITAIRNAIANRQLAEAMTIDTVERYQGSQRDIIIFNTVVTHPEHLDMISTPVELSDGTIVDRKLNVALTRARERITIVGHRSTLVRSDLYRALIDEMTHISSEKSAKS